MLILGMKILDNPLPKNLQVAAKFIVKMIGGAMKQLIKSRNQIHNLAMVLN